MDYTVVVDSDGQTLTQDTAGGVVIRCTDAAGNSFWRPVAEVRGGPEEAQADLGIELGPVAVAPQAAEAVADTPARQPATPEAPEAETDAQARARRAEIRTQIAAANEYRRQATWAREEAARTAEEEEAAEEGEQAEEEGEGTPGDFWTSTAGTWAGCAVWFWGPPVLFFPLRALCWHFGWEAGAIGVSILCGLAFWVGYIWFLGWQDRERSRRELRARLDAAAGVQQGGGVEA